MEWEAFLDKTLQKYERWQEEGKISQTAKVIPVGQSLEAKQWVMPTEQVFSFLRDSRSFALSSCQCRSLGKHCDRPVEVCFFVNDAADALVEKGKARRLTLEEAKERLALANKSGLVHMTLFNPKQHLFAVCSCCTCCCHDLQFLLKQGRTELVAHSEYLAVQDEDLCTHCGECIERCPFGARTRLEEEMAYDPSRCYGCGLCVTTCPTEAVELKPRRSLKEEARRSA